MPCRSDIYLWQHAIFISEMTHFFNRMDSTLVDFSDMKWQRGDLTFIFNGDAKGMCTALH